MKKKKMNSVMCCFCSESLNFENAVQLSIIVDNESNEVQGLFCHKECIDKVLHKSVPRHPDLFDNN